MWPTWSITIERTSCLKGPSEQKLVFLNVGEREIKLPDFGYAYSNFANLISTSQLQI